MSHFIFQSRQTWLAVLGLLIVVAAASAQNATAEQTQKRFATAEEAVQGVIKAAKTNNQAELLVIFGADAEDLFSSGDKVADQVSWNNFVQSYEASHALVKRDDGAVEEQLTGALGDDCRLIDCTR
jgi:type II secretory pathway pseudopilin PulG